MIFAGELSYWDAYGKVRWSTISPENGWEMGASHAANRNIGVAFDYAATADSLSIRSFSENGKSRVRRLVMLPDWIATADSKCSLIIPHGSGMLVHCHGHEWAEHEVGVYFPWGSAGLMTAFGLTDGAVTRVLLVDGARHDFSIRVRNNWDGIYSLAASFHLRDEPWDTLLDDAPGVVIGELAGGYETLACFYRKHFADKLGLVPLAEKFKTSPVLEHNSRSLLMRCRLAVKECPPTVLEQAPENPPPPKVYMTFADVRDLLDECRRQGVGPLDCCLVGWNLGGHDGAYPQLFPVEAALGGERELVKTLTHAKTLGYAAGLHDNYFDSYTIADNFDWRALNRDADLSPSRSGQWGGGQSWVVCPQCAYDNAIRNLDEVKRRLPVTGTYFTDVVTVWPLEKCYDTVHPLSRRECAEWRGKTLDLARARFGCIMSEGGHDWALPHLDRCYDLVDTPEPLPFCDEEIPLFQMTWHGYLVYNTYRCGINRLNGTDLYLRNIAFGGMPMVYWHYLFNPAQDFPPEQDLVFSADTLRAEVARIKRVSDDIARLAPLRSATLDRFEIRPDNVTETRYSNGLSCLVNFAQRSQVVLGRDIPARDFVVTKTAL